MIERIFSAHTIKLSCFQIILHQRIFVIDAKFRFYFWVQFILLLYSVFDNKCYLGIAI